MKSEYSIRSAMKAIEGSMDELKDQAGPFQTYSLFGIVDALKWVMDEPSHLNELLAPQPFVKNKAEEG